ncbi:DUF1129 family protein [Paenibacillus lentus]|uniref:DUF1129 family protein n=1 Tax=Paenibacillus lentus TaxID=1338368 RepID=A0A3Q8SEJ9_9BACL|nr:DUF1129 family protein [Paenibacillus lentus]AZK48723.1 DUF1129 family protein [Paenibacillus lentus]
MYIHEMIRETNQLRGQMSPANEAYFGEMVMYFRSGSSSLTEAKGEEVLLTLARRIIKYQEKNISASELFGDDPKAYCEQLADDVLMKKPRSLQDKIKYYTMIPWVALTWVFFIYMLTGFFSKWFGGELEYTQISTASLILIAVLSILLIEGVTRFLGPGTKRRTEQEQPHHQSTKYNPKTVGIYLGITIAIAIVGLGLTRLLPAFTVSPWDSLIIFAIGIVGQKLIFGRKSKS